MVPTKEDKKLINQFKKRLIRKTGTAIKKIVFFGSRAKGLAAPESDFDVLLVVDKKEPALIDKIYEVSTDYSFKNAIDISLKIYPLEVYRQKSSLPIPFFTNIKENGIEIWNKIKKN